MSNPDYNLNFTVSPEMHKNITQYKKALANNIAEEIEVHAICTGLIIKSRWASWLPFGWMHSIAANYYARKARRIYNTQQIAKALNNSTQ
jgi:hypothetical protein